MKKNKIFKKLFLMTAGVVMVILVLQFVFQYFWIEKFYIYNKKKNVSSTLITLKDKIEKNLIDEKKIEKSLNQYSMENNIFIGIFNSQGISQYGFDGENRLSYIRIKDEEMETYKIYIDGFSNNEEFIKSLKLDKKIKIQGLLQTTEERSIYPDSIIIDNKEFAGQHYKDLTAATASIKIEGNNLPFILDNTDVNLITIEEGDLIEPQLINISGSIIDMNIISKENYGIEYRKNQLLQEIFLFLGQEKKLNTIFRNNQMVQYTKIDSFTGIKNIIFVQPLFMENRVPMLMFAVSSLQPIEETTEIMKTYFLVILILAMILTMIAAYLYSKKITTPLIYLNEVTKNMARLDFTQKCEIHTNDEIMDLAENINSMSEKLKLTLEELQGSNEKLKEDILLKEKTEQFRKRFIADASHELKTPLTVMKGICEGIVDGIYDYTDKQHLKNILTQINDMSRLVYELLEISKLESKKVSLNKEAFQLNDLVLKVHDKLKPILQTKQLKVQLHLTEDFVLGDENKIEKVIRNLYYNAVQYTPENGKINICMDRDKNECYLNIENVPAKISKDDLSKIWEPFYRVEKSRNKTLGGSGLGLYMVKEILDKHKSQYNIGNTDEGVKVYFSLQRVENEEVE